MTNLRHQLAIYYDGSGMRQRIFAKDLSVDSVREVAKLNTLWDETEQFNLGVRASSDGLQHFFEIAQRGNRDIFDTEKNQIHDERVAELEN